MHDWKRIRLKGLRPTAGRDDMAMDYFSLNRLIAEKGIDALPGPRWVPLGRDNIPRHGPTVQDDWKMF